MKFMVDKNPVFQTYDTTETAVLDFRRQGAVITRDRSSKEPFGGNELLAMAFFKSC